MMQICCAQICGALNFTAQGSRSASARLADVDSWRIPELLCLHPCLPYQGAYR